jgi:polyvinyl alcohol dehydrogenase (cytochrome)
MTHASVTRFMALGTLLLPLTVGAVCPPSCAIPGGGDPFTDCLAEFTSEGIRLNYPPFDPAHPKAGKEVRCFDGDVGCDQDGVTNGQCVFDVDVCLRNADPSLPACTPADVTAVAVSGTTRDPELLGLQTALSALVPATSNVCTAGRVLTVKLKGPDGLGRFKLAKKKVKLVASTAGGNDSDTVKLTCLPRGWPSHGYDRRNVRAASTAVETRLTTTNASSLVPKWNLNFETGIGASNNGVSSTPAVGFGLVYVGSWNGLIVAAKQTNGSLKWTYDTQSQNVGLVPGVSGSVTLTPDGRALAGDANAVLYCLNAKNGKLIWKTPLGNPAVDQIWGSPTVAGDRVFIGIASHSDNPCTNGRLIALDLDTGTVLWTHQTVPDRICTSDTAVTCVVDGDCPNGGTCVPGIGAGVTATVSTDETGDFVYMNTVGCYRFPSIGDSDSIFKLDAATGATVWKTRVQPPEQFSACAGDPGVDCRDPGDCAVVGGPCNTKAFYHDFGFLNGPLVVEADDGMGGTRELVVSGSKDGSLYARDPMTGAPVWTRAVRPSPVTPAFAGFGLFDGAVGFAEDRFFAALYDFTPPLVGPPKHLQAFSAVDGSMLWEDEIGVSFSGVGIANGLVAMGTLAASNVYVYDAATGVRLTTLAIPATTSAGPSIVDGTIYVGYGLGGATGGVAAFGLP